MRIYDIIVKKRSGLALSREEIRFAVEGFVSGDIPDYQMSALLMAIYFRHMDAKETAALTHYMAASGDMVDLSPIPGIKVDKHSTGGVGDKTSLIALPIVAACGAPVAKMSGRGLGHTGGTIDKLESIPGFKTDIPKSRFFDIVNSVGLAIIGQTGNIAPADKKLYALRDVTATVDNMSLIASSIMSKKIAAGADAILLDVKTGSGAFMKTVDDSIALACAMISIGEHVGRKTVALVTDMDLPLGNAIGNSLEVIEAVQTLKNRGASDLTALCLDIAGNMLHLATGESMDVCMEKANDALSSGRAYEKFKEMVSAQGGDTCVLEDTDLFKSASITHPVTADTSGFIHHMDTESCGIASVVLGAGHLKKEDSIDYSAGIRLLKKTGDSVKKGDVIAQLLTCKEESVEEAEGIFRGAVTIKETAPQPKPLVLARVSAEGVIRK